MGDVKRPGGEVKKNLRRLHPAALLSLVEYRSGRRGFSPTRGCWGLPCPDLQIKAPEHVVAYSEGPCLYLVPAARVVLLSCSTSDKRLWTCVPAHLLSRTQVEPRVRGSVLQHPGGDTLSRCSHVTDTSNIQLDF